MRNVSAMNYSDFCEYLSGDGYDKFDVILEYDDFCVYKELTTGKYFYLECGENDASDFFEVEVVAVLKYDALHDLKWHDAEKHLIGLFDCCCCGEHESNASIEYIWFQRAKDPCLTKPL